MESRDSQSLVEHAAAGDRDALDRMFARSLPRLRRLLRVEAGVALRHGELDDLVQEAYLEATKRFVDYTYQGPGSFSRWLATVALHRVANLRRTVTAQKRDPRKERRIAGAASTMSSAAVQPVEVGPGPRTMAFGAEVEARIDAAMARLGVDEREIITLARLQGLSLGEIAERTGRTKNAIALRLSRALRKLKDGLGGLGGIGGIGP